MARVAMCVDRESWRPAPLPLPAAGSVTDDFGGAGNERKCRSPRAAFGSEEVLKSGLGSTSGTVPDGNFVSVPAPEPVSERAHGLALTSIAFSLDDDEAQKQAKEYSCKLQQEEHKRKRHLDEVASGGSGIGSGSSESSGNGIGSTSSSGSESEWRRGWTHGAEMKFDAGELLVTKTVLLSGSSCAAKRAELREYFHRTFSLYERLFELLADGSVFYRRPDSLRHPLIFYYGHTAVFFINKLMLGKFISKRIDEKMESTCAIGVDEMSWDDLNDSHYDWPTPEAVRNYRNLVRSTVDDVIQSAPLKLPISWDSPLWVVLMGIEHERIHLETSTVLIRQLPIECVRPHPLWQICPTRRTAPESVPRNSLIPLPGGEVVLGKDVQSAVLYGWDNEYGRRVGTVAPFSVSQFLVSNAEWLEFMADGAYERQEFWTSEGWKFIQFKNAQRKFPIFWVPVDGSIAPSAKAENFRYRALSEIIEMPWDWPVEVNELEAKAFTNWKARKTGRNIRLPTEDEYCHMRNIAFPLRPKAVQPASAPASASASASTSASTLLAAVASSTSSVAHDEAPPVGDQPYWSVAPGNINLEHFASSNPVDEFAFALPASTSSSSPAAQLFDVIGNVWQHTETPIAPFAGFQFHPLYDDFSIPTFDNMHNLLMGGSWISTGNEAIRAARYAFRRHFYQFAGIRYVDSNESVTIQEQTPSTETDVAVANMAAAHYSKLPAPFGQMPNALVQLARIIMEAVETERFRFARSPRKPALFNQRDLSAMDLAMLEGVSHLPPAFERVLDLGCGAGRLAFELAFPGNHPHAANGHSDNSAAAGSAAACAFESVVGIDLSTRFLRVGDSLKHGGKFHYLVKSEGDLDAFHAIDLTDASWCARNDIPWAAHADTRQKVCARVDFMQSDAHNFDGKHSDFDVIVLSHLLEDMYDPKQLLSMIHAPCKVGGLLVILSDYHWRTEKTEKANWLGGKKESTGESVNTLNALDSALQQHFIRISKPLTLQQIRRCTDRVFTLHQSELTIWRRFK